MVSQVINVSVHVNTMVRSLPGSLDDDRAFNANAKKNISHKASSLGGFGEEASSAPVSSMAVPI